MIRLLALSLVLTFVTHATAAGLTAGATRTPKESPPAASAGQSAPAEIRREIEELNRRMVETLKKGDLPGVAAFYADDATIIYPRGKKLHGRKAIDGYWTGIKGAKDWVLEVQEVGGDRETVYQTGRSTFTSETDGKQSVYACDFVLIWKRQKDGRYKIHVDIFN